MTMNGYLQLGWNKSCVDVKVGEHCTIPWPKCNWSGACVKYCYCYCYFGHGIVQCSPTFKSTQDLFQQNCK